jgi:type II secretory pathway pseudopilin PulG
MYSQLERNAGTTLIEIIVAILILGIFMAIAIPGITNSFQTIDQTKRLTARYPAVRRGLDTMSSGIRQTYPAALSQDSPFVGRDGSFEAGGIKLPSDELSFPVLDTSYAHVRSTQLVSYRLQLNPEEEDSPRGLVQTRSFLGTDARRVMQETVLERVVGLDFAYLDDSIEPPRWVGVWPPASSQSAASSDATAATPQDGMRVPGAVRITILVPGEISPKPRSFTTIVNIPAR